MAYKFDDTEVAIISPASRTWYVLQRPDGEGGWVDLLDAFGLDPMGASEQEAAEQLARTMATQNGDSVRIVVRNAVWMEE